MRSPGWDIGADHPERPSRGVSLDGKRIALIRTSQTGQQLVTFTTARPNDVATVLDLSGSGERAMGVVWAVLPRHNLINRSLRLH